MIDPLSAAPPAATALLPSPLEAMPGSVVRTATAADVDRCTKILTLAFESDPPCRWVWPDRAQYLQAFPRFVRAFAGGAFTRGAAHYYEGFRGVALWLPPGFAVDEESLIKVIEETAAPERLDAAFSMFEQMGAYHPAGPHWHLPLIGVDPASQGRGIGSALLRPMLEQCDRQQLPAYLEATSPGNIALYTRLGFEALGNIQVADSPPVVPMLRKPR